MTRLKKYRAVFTLCAALGWWGIWFPELAVWTDAVCVTEEKAADNCIGQEKEETEYCTVRDLYKGLIHAEPEQILLKSRLLQLIEKYLQKK